MGPGNPRWPKLLLGYPSGARPGTLSYGRCEPKTIIGCGASIQANANPLYVGYNNVICPAKYHDGGCLRISTDIEKCRLTVRGVNAVCICSTQCNTPITSAPDRRFKQQGRISVHVKEATPHYRFLFMPTTQLAFSRVANTMPSSERYRSDVNLPLRFLNHHAFPEQHEARSMTRRRRRPRATPTSGIRRGSMLQNNSRERAGRTVCTTTRPEINRRIVSELSHPQAILHEFRWQQWSL